jgi:hypothetical protein
MIIPPNYRKAKLPKCLNCVSYMGIYHGYLSHDKCEIFGVLVCSQSVCDEYREKIEQETPIEIKEWMHVEGEDK